MPPSTSQLTADRYLEQGNACLARNDLPAAIAAYQRAIEICPDFTEAFYNCGVALHQQGRLASAITHYSKAVNLFPDFSEAYFNLASAYSDLNQYAESQTAYHKVLQLQPDNAAALYNLGLLHQAMADNDNAIRMFEKAIEIKPDYVEAINNIGVIYRDQDDLEKAQACFEKAMAMNGNFAEAPYNLGVVCQKKGRLDDALAYYARALEVDGEYAPAKWLSMLSLPMHYENEKQINAYRERFSHNLSRLIQETPLQTATQKKRALQGLSATSNFYLQYQGCNDLALQQQYGRFAADIMAANFPQWAVEKKMPPLSDGEKIRIGYLSSCMYGHTIGIYLLGWLREPDRDHFEWHAYHVGARTDALTEQIAQSVDRFHHVPGDLKGAAGQIEKDRLHILVHTDIGMNPITLQLAALRLAPVQCKGWGHPVTTGLPTIDYYLTSDLMEQDHADQHYCEKLIRLPNLALNYTPPLLPTQPKSRQYFKIQDKATLFLTTQSLFKYLPQHDDIFPRIGQQVPDAVFVFIAHKTEEATEQFAARLSKAFAAHNVPFNCIFVPHMQHADFLSLNMNADVLLDTLEWSGGKTTLEALTCDLPVVTLPGEYMRGRHTYAFLTRLGLTETIAVDKPDYIRIAVRLGLDRDYREKVKTAIRTRKKLLFDDHRVNSALVHFFKGLFPPTSNITTPGENRKQAMDKSIAAEDLFQQASELHTDGRTDEACTLYLQALQVKPDLAEAHFNVALIYYENRTWDQAVAHYQQALTCRPSWPAAWYNLAQTFEKKGAQDLAIEAYYRALEHQPDYPEALFNLGCILLDAGNPRQAQLLFTKVTNIQPDNSPAYNNLGKSLQSQGLFEQAGQAYLKCAQLTPAYGVVWFNLAEIAVAQGQLQIAIEHYNKAIELQPEMQAAHNNLGEAYRRLKQYDRAEACFEKVIKLNPGLAQGHYNLGSTLRQKGNYESAMISLLKAIQLNPDYAEAWNNLALACKNIRDMDRALTCFNRAIELDPKLAVARWNRSFIHLLKEDYLAAWPDFEWRFRMPQRDSIYPFELAGPRWQGQSVPASVILVHDEQGLGDTLQMVRYLPLVKARCGRLILETRPELTALLQNAPGIDGIEVRSANGRPEATYDYHVPLMSLPGIFQTTVQTVPPLSPFIATEPARIERWRRKLPPADFCIGLVWAGRPQHTNDKNRSCPLAEFAPLLNMEGVSMVGLQKGPGADQPVTLPGGHIMANLGPAFEDFCDTAAAIASLDLVITVDTAVAHLAGVMAKPVWVMIPYIPDWRWGLHGEQSPWYPSMRLFRQNTPGDWPGVVQQMARALDLVVGKRCRQT